jgi:hypothetical protein
MITDCFKANTEPTEGIFRVINSYQYFSSISESGHDKFIVEFTVIC